MLKETKQVVDPHVSQAKFHKELTLFQSLESTFYRERGIILENDSFPKLLVSFSTTKLVRSIHVFTVQIDFTNYDLEPPSIIFVDHETKKPIKIEQLQTRMMRKIKVADSAKEKTPLIPLIMAQKADHKPFVCIPGVREYHQHPSHTNDPWIVHRGSGEGTLGFLLDQLYEYGTNAIIGYSSKDFGTRNIRPGMVPVKINDLPWTYDLNQIPL